MKALFVEILVLTMKKRFIALIAIQSLKKALIFLFTLLKRKGLFQFVFELPESYLVVRAGQNIVVISKIIDPADFDHLVVKLIVSFPIVLEIMRLYFP